MYGTSLSFPVKIWWRCFCFVHVVPSSAQWWGFSLKWCVIQGLLPSFLVFWGAAVQHLETPNTSRQTGGEGFVSGFPFQVWEMFCFVVLVEFSTKRHLSGAHVRERLQDDASESNGIVGFQAQKLPDCNADVSETGVGSQNPEGSSPSALRSLFGVFRIMGLCWGACTFVLLWFCFALHFSFLCPP